jgi:phosphoribosylformylglycinamidine synthase
MYLPIAHAEGKFVARDAATLERLDKAGQLVLRYSTPSGSCPIPSDSLLPYPENPNGAQLNVAGLCDETGRVFGLMPHPERHIDPTQHPRWTRERRERGDGLAVFENAVQYFA